MLSRSSILWKKVNVEFSPSHVSQTTVAKNFVCLLPSCVTSIRLDFKYRDDWTERLNFEELSARLQELSPHLEMLILDRAILSNTLSSIIDLCTQCLPNVKSLVLHNAEFPVFSATRECDDASKIEVLDLFGSYLGCNVQDNTDILSMPLLKKLRLARTDIDNAWFENNSSLLIQLHVLDLGFTKIDSRTFDKIKNYSLNLSELYLCWVYLENYDLNFDNSVLDHLKTMCLRSCFGVSCEGVVQLIQSCPSLQTVYADEEVAESYSRHPFVAVNKSKSKIVQVLTTCFAHQKIHY